MSSDKTTIIYQRLINTEKGKKFFSVIQKNIKTSDINYIEKILKDYFYEEMPEKVISYTIKKKYLRLKSYWYDKTIEAYEEYQKYNNCQNTKKGRSIGKYIIEQYENLKKLYNKSGEDLFKDITKFKTPDDAFHSILTNLKDWKESDESLLIEYPFFSSFAQRSKEKAIEIDGIILIGTEFKDIIENEENLALNKEEINEQLLLPLEGNSEEKYVGKMPSFFLETPFTSLPTKKEYEVTNHEILETMEGKLVKIKHHSKHELEDELEMYFDRLGIEKRKEQEQLTTNRKRKPKSKLRTPVVDDEILFIKMLEYRDANFQRDKRIFIYLSDLIKDVYGSASVENYDNLRERLWSLGNFRLVKRYSDGGFKIRSLFQSLDVIKDEQDRWIVDGIVSDQIRDAILRDNFVKIYSEKINELNNPLAIHLAFLVQKMRILHYVPNKEDDMISFKLTWSDLKKSIRTNKRSRSENMQMFKDSLSEIKKKGFLIHEFQPHTTHFFIKCYNLNSYELKDQANIRKLFQEKSPTEILEGIENKDQVEK